MRKKPSAKGSSEKRKRAGAVGDLPIKSLKGGDAAAIKGGDLFLKLTSIKGED